MLLRLYQKEYDKCKRAEVKNDLPFFVFHFPLDCFRDDSGLNALRIKKCLSESSLNSFPGLSERTVNKPVLGAGVTNIGNKKVQLHGLHF
jgi:hypothetical protein